MLYDIAHPRKNASSQDASSSSPDAVNAQFNSGEISSSTKQSHSSKVPVKKRECLKFKGRDRADDEPLQNRKAAISDCVSPGKIHVVIPPRSHSLQKYRKLQPFTISRPIKGRWRMRLWWLGRGMPSQYNRNIQIAGDHILIDSQHPLELFFQGKIDNIPALTIRVIDDRQYAVDFHAKLSSLQAFSICVAILHTAEAFIVVGQEPNKQMLQCDSLSVFSDEEMKNLIDSGTEESKSKVRKKVEKVLPSLVLNPPFPPIARV